MKELPKFKKEPVGNVITFMMQALTHPDQPEVSYFRRIIEYDDGHFGAVFNLDYFEKTEIPTKSQWNSLKKKLKRHDKRIFVFKEQRIAPCDENDEQAHCGQLEFGFFAH